MYHNKLKSTLLACLLIFAGLWTLAEDVTFPAGSIIIPMDSQTQDTTNEGIFEAYGLVYYLLTQHFTLHLAVNEDKPSNDYPDFDIGTTPITIPWAEAYVPVTPIPTAYGGGPWIIDASEVQAVLDILAVESPRFDHVVMHQIQAPITVPIRGSYYIDDMPKIALLNNSHNEGYSLLACYLRLADIPEPYYDVLEADDILAGALNELYYYIIWLPHWTEAEEGMAAEPLFTNIKHFADFGGHVLATCKSIDAMESFDPLHTDKSLGINGNITADRVYNSLDLPFSQIGDYPFVPDPTIDTQSIRNYQSGDTAATGHTPNPSNWQANVNLIVTDTTPDDPWAFYTLRQKDSDPNKGNIHYIAGHRYVSCEPIISPGVQYRIDMTMQRCDNKSVAFWQNTGESLTIVIHYDGGQESLTVGPLLDGTYDVWQNEDFIAQTSEDRTNYGPGCHGAGDPDGTDHFDGLLIQNQTTNNYRITQIDTIWDCGYGCNSDYTLSEFNIQVDNGLCGTSSCDFCSNVYPDYRPHKCDSDDEVSFVPIAKKGGGTDVIFEGGVADGEVGTLTPRPINIGGIRYILNTLLNAPVNPVERAEFSRSGAVIYDNVAYFGSFEYPDNAGHFKAYPLIDDNGNTVTTLQESWDAGKMMPSWVERKLYTFINGTKYQIGADPATVNAIEAYIDDPSDTYQSVEADILNFLGHYLSKRMGGVEHSTPAIVPPNDRSNPNRPALAYVGTTYGVLEQIDLETGIEYGGYVPAAMLKRLNNTGLNDPNRPKVDASPTVLDAFLPLDRSDPKSSREWQTVMITGHGSGPAGISAIDITNPDNIKLMWEKFDPALIGHVKRASVTRYRKKLTATDGSTVDVLGYMAVVPSTLPGTDSHGLMVQAFDLQTGESIWEQPFIATYENFVNDIPAPVSIWDKNGDSFGDSVFVGDLNGRLWILDLQTGKPSGPIINTGVDRPIAAAPSVGVFNGKTVVVIGTGGVDWANSTNNVIIAYNLSEPNPGIINTIDIGEYKIFSSISIAADELIYVAVKGSLNSADPRVDIAPDDGQDYAFIGTIPMSPNSENPPTRIATEKGSSTPYVKDGHTVEVTSEGTLKLYGDHLPQNFIDLLKQLIWRDLTYVR